MNKSMAVVFFMLVFLVTSNASAEIQYYDNSSIGLSDDEYDPVSVTRINETGLVIGSAVPNGFRSYERSSVWLFNGSTTVQVGLTDAEHTYGEGYQKNSSRLLNNAWQVAGTAINPGRTRTTGARDAWIYDGVTTTQIGLPTETTVSSLWSNDTRYLNESGQVAGTLFGYDGYLRPYIGWQHNAWLFNGSATVSLGLTGAGYTYTGGFLSTDSSVRGMNESGQVIGTSQRFIENDIKGTSAWVYNGTTTVRIGLTDPSHTNADGIERNTSYLLNEAGQVAGLASRYNESGANIGSSAWFYDSNTSTQIGMTNTSHTSTNGSQINSVDLMNEAGQVAGSANRYTGNTPSGSSSWLYNGNSTVQIGLTETSDYQYNQSRVLNEAGQVAGAASRYVNVLIPDEYGFPIQTAVLKGTSVWVSDGVTTLQTGLTDEMHTNEEGYHYNDVSFMNESGLVAGLAVRFDGTTELGQDGWLFNSVLNEIQILDYFSRSDGYGFSSVEYLGDDGLVLGRYNLFDSNDTDLGFYAFALSATGDYFDLGFLFQDDMHTEAWSWLSDVYRANGAGYIVDNLSLVDLYTSPVASSVPVPVSFWLFGSGLIGLVSFSRRKKG